MRNHTDYVLTYLRYNYARPKSFNYITVYNTLEHAIFHASNALHVIVRVFADDTILFSYSKEGLQFQLNQLYTYCSNWGITVNTAKTVVMVFKKHNRRKQLNCCTITKYQTLFNILPIWV